MNSATRKSGFTLIELLVVIAIIAILAAILFPVFVNAKAAAKITTCSAHYKQLAAAFQAYAADHGNTAPMVVDKSDTLWSCWLLPYAGRKVQFFYCASLPQRSDQVFDPSDPSRTGSSALHWTTVGMNIVFGNASFTTTKTPVVLSQVKSPTKTILFGCSSYKNYGAQYARWGVYQINPGLLDAKGYLCLAERVRNNRWQFNMFDESRHDGKVVIAHVDGHVKTYKIDELLTPGLPGNAQQSQLYRNPNYSLWDLY